EAGAARKLFRAAFYQPLYNTLIFFIRIAPRRDLGLAIILLTLLIRVILLVPSQRAMVSQRHMQELQPKLDHLRKKYEGNQERLAKETMQLWKEHKVNPFGSCLPILVQFPVLIALFYVIQNGLNPDNAHLLYAPFKDTDFSAIHTKFLGILELTKMNVIVLPLIAKSEKERRRAAGGRARTKGKRAGLGNGIRDENDDLCDAGHDSHFYSLRAGRRRALLGRIDRLRNRATARRKYATILASMNTSAPSSLSLEDLMQETLAEVLQRLGVTFRKFKMAKDDNHPSGVTVYRLDIDTDEASMLIGFHGETIYALQHILKSLIWKKTNQNVFIVVDVDSYRQRQEESVLTLAVRKVENARKTMQDQVLPPMSPYFRRVVHMALAKPEFSDIATESTGDGDQRAVVIKVKA
ncbi:membrane protein insertase YidC, partial [Candidatus Peregrinibacteria bacterium]|nr:membrane protein insertase YidC [Candidatus Peregrinibacteria bacterium]